MTGYWSSRRINDILYLIEIGGRKYGRVRDGTESSGIKLGFYINMYLVKGYWYVGCDTGSRLFLWYSGWVSK